MERIIRELYLNIGRYAVDFLRSSPVAPPHTIKNPEILQSILAQHKGSIALLAHLGNWELLAVVYGKLLPDLSVVAKPMKNKFVDKWLAEKRKRADVSTIYTRNATRKMLEAIKRKGVVAVLIDQHAGKHGAMVPFLGKMANTVKAVAGMVQKTDCEVFTIYAIMLKDGSYDVVLKRAPSPGEEKKGEQERIDEYMRLHNEVISEWVRKYPEHYFGWFHKRFRGKIRYSLISGCILLLLKE